MKLNSNGFMREKKFTLAEKEILLSAYDEFIELFKFNNYINEEFTIEHKGAVAIVSNQNHRCNKFVFYALEKPEEKKTMFVTLMFMESKSKTGVSLFRGEVSSGYPICFIGCGYTESAFIIEGKSYDYYPSNFLTERLTKEYIDTHFVEDGKEDLIFLKQGNVKIEVALFTYITSILEGFGLIEM